MIDIKVYKIISFIYCKNILQIPQNSGMNTDSFGNLCYLLQCYDTNETYSSFALRTYDQSLVRENLIPAVIELHICWVSCIRFNFIVLK